MRGCRSGFESQAVERVSESDEAWAGREVRCVRGFEDGFDLGEAEFERFFAAVDRSSPCPRRESGNSARVAPRLDEHENCGARRSFLQAAQT